MRKESKTEKRVEIKALSSYHGGHYKQLSLYNSDRVIKLDSDYKVSRDNTASTLKLVKEGKEANGYGIEWEMVCGETNNRTIVCNLMHMIFENVFPDDLFKIESDCTVDVECISQVMTKAFIRNNYNAFKAVYQRYFPAFGITTNDERCGMHVNLSLALLGKDRDTQIENARKLGYLINKHYDLFKVAFNRLGSTRWCPRMRHTMDYWKTNSIYDFPTSHDECCVNMGHVRQGRLEIRLVGGQKNFACFRNTMEVVFHIVDNIKSLKWEDLDDLTKVFSGCNNYVFDRLSTNCLQANVISASDIEKIRPSVKPVQYL